MKKKNKKISLNPIELLLSFERLLSKVEGFCLSASLSVMLGFTSLQVILRNVFHTGIEWGDVFSRHLVLYVIFFGASLATRDKTHLQMDLAGKLVPQKLKLPFNILLGVFSTGVTFFLFQAAWMFFLDEKASGETLFSGIPTWIFVFIIPLGFGLITFRFFVHLVETVYRVFRKEKIDLEFNHSPEMEAFKK